MARERRLSCPHIRCLAQFADESEVTVKELTHRLGLSHSRLSHVLEWLEASDLISRRINPEDRRIVIVHVTGRGRAVVDALEVRLDRCYERALSDLPGDASEAAIAALAHALELANPGMQASSRRRA